MERIQRSHWLQRCPLGDSPRPDAKVKAREGWDACARRRELPAEGGPLGTAQAPVPSCASKMSKYVPSRLASLPPTLDHAEYDTSSEVRRAQIERLAIRARLKRQYLLQYDNPHRRGIIEDPALIRWTYARTANIYPNFRPTPKTSFLGAVFGIGPLFFWYYVFKTDRDRKERLIQEGKWERPLSITY